MTFKLNDGATHEASQALLGTLYREGIIPAEKKPFVVDLSRSAGPYLAIFEDDVAILDAASQIATLALGLNHSALFGVAQHLSAWINDATSDEYRRVRAAFEDLLRRKLGAPNYSVSFCHSGAEAIELALSECYRQQGNRGADRVLAFTGSFHGRTKIALESTWSPEKRQPFSWLEHASIFAPYPEADISDPRSVPAPQDWLELWCAQNETIFSDRIQTFQRSDNSLLRLEIESLLAVRQALQSGGVLTILIEPMQSEGGDRYSSGRFHQGLASLAKTFRVPLIYDEIQTGFHLGRTFFWHRQFELSDGGQAWIPDFVIAAKKAQLGVILSRDPINPKIDVCAASLIRGYINASMLDQFGEEISVAERRVQENLHSLVDKHRGVIGRPRNQGWAFAFDFKDAESLQRAIALRFEHGLIFYQAGDRTARFRLNLSFHDSEIDLVFEQLDSLLTRLADANARPATPVLDLPTVTRHFDFHRKLITEKLAAQQGRFRGARDIAADLAVQLRELEVDEAGIEVKILDPDNYPNYRQRILQIQVEVYEPARQTPGEDFDRVFAAPRPLAVVVEQGEKILGMAFAGRLGDFGEVSGVSTDPLRDHDDAAYMVDTTVMPPLRGVLGRYLKQAIVQLAIARGYRTMHGRNRDHLARGMWAINLSLGSSVSQWLVDDYHDAEQYRDCLYYQCPVSWSPPRVHLSRGIEAPLGWSDLSPDFLRRNMPLVVNKLTLSNFVDASFIEDMHSAVSIFPRSLRHAYSASGVSEAIDKVVKSIWRHRAPRQRLLTFGGHYFGIGTMLSQSLSGAEQPRFQVMFVDEPKDASDESPFRTLQSALEHDDILACFVEPVPWQTMKPLSIETLRRIREMCSAVEVPLVFHESAAMFYRHSSDAFCPSGLETCEPDATVVSLGGQMALALLHETLFVSSPLQIISTWDGDGFSLAQFVSAATAVTKNTDAHFQLQKEFESALLRELQSYPGVEFQLSRGCGWIRGQLSSRWTSNLRQNDLGRYLVCPSPAAMREFVASRHR